MSHHRFFQIFTRHSTPIINNRNRCSATINNIYDDLVCPRIQRIFNQFFDNTGRIFNNLAGGDLIDQKIWQHANRHKFFSSPF